MLAPHMTLHTDTIPTGFISGGKALPHARHMFGTRADTHADTNKTVRLYTERLGPIAHMQQVHGNRIAYAHTSGVLPECDAVYTDQQGLWLAVKTADCVPVLISSPNAVAAVHAGWRGLQAEIIPQTIKLLCDEFGQLPDDLHVAIGPCISQKNYEVEGHFMDLFKPRLAKYFAAGQDDDHLQMDTAGIARAQALEAGVLDIHITSIGRCTFEDAATFNSYRRHKSGKDANYASQLSLIQRR